jgi:hypothetical protein
LQHRQARKHSAQIRKAITQNTQMVWCCRQAIDHAFHINAPTGGSEPHAAGQFGLICVFCVNRLNLSAVEPFLRDAAIGRDG